MDAGLCRCLGRAGVDAVARCRVLRGDAVLISQVDRKIDGWRWVASEFRRALAEARAEVERLYGPDRGE